MLSLSDNMATGLDVKLWKNASKHGTMYLAAKYLERVFLSVANVLVLVLG